MKQKPRILYSELSERWFYVTRYKELPDGVIQALGNSKVDITDQIGPLLKRERQACAAQIEGLQSPEHKPGVNETLVWAAKNIREGDVF